jgi:outer membrane immunogenic protein
MKRILFTTVSLGVLAAVSPALAADLGVYTKAPAVASPIYDWTGVYIGAFGGGGFGNHNINNGAAAGGNVFGVTNFSANYASQGGLGGGEIGYNWQSGNIMFGVEGDVFGSGIKGNDIAAVNAAIAAGNPLPVGSTDATSLRWGATARARAGFTVDRLLLFFTGGLAYGDFSHTDVSLAAGGKTDAFTFTRSGLTAGAGIAYALTNNVLGKFEYRYYNFDTFNRTTPTNGVTPYGISNTYSVVTLGLDFKFGGPVVAKY